MTERVIERVARAIDPEAMASANPNLRAIGLRKARAAVEAMRSSEDYKCPQCGLSILGDDTPF